MKLIIAGSRTFFPDEAYDLITSSMRFFDIRVRKITEIVNGGNNRGIDAAAKIWARHRSIPRKYFHPPYTRMHPMQAPLYRNTQIVEYADAILVIWDGSSPGSRDILLKARAMMHPENVYLKNTSNNGMCPAHGAGIEYDNGFFSEVLSGSKIVSSSRTAAV